MGVSSSLPESRASAQGLMGKAGVVDVRVALLAEMAEVRLDLGCLLAARSIELCSGNALRLLRCCFIFLCLLFRFRGRFNCRALMHV